MIYRIFILFLFSIPFLSFSQEEELQKKEDDLKVSKNYTWEGNKNLSENNFVAAEVDYRRAIAKSPENSAAPYNLGNAYYNRETYSEAFGRFKEAGEVATSKTEKHKAYHNMGNVFMKRKDYAKAVEAYKEALRNDPKDEETRYNLALAKELLKKDEENKDQNQDKQDNQENQDNQDQKDKNNDQDKDGENKDKGDQDKDQKDEGDEGDQNEQQKDENKEGDGDEKKEQNKKPEEGDNNDQQQPPRPNQLSKQQIENLLRAMQNAEKQVQEKIDAKKVKGAKVKNEKDW
jgi:tetratricopeptide (TPR) repeat protein